MPPASGPRKVKKAKPTPAAKSPVFGPPTRADAPIVKAQAKAHKQTAKARKAVERNVVVPAIPKLKHLTDQQRGTAKRQVATSLRKQGIRTKADVKALPKVQRERVNRAIGYAHTADVRAQAATALANGYAGKTVRETAAIGRQIARSNRAEVTPGHPHKQANLGIASIDLTLASRKLGEKLAGNPAAAFMHGTTKLGEYAGKHLGVPGRALQDAIDLPANTVSSVYYVGKQGATGHPLKAGEAVLAPIVHTLKHPIQSFDEHPLNTVLIGRGVKGAIGHTAGKVMRTGALGAGAKRAAGTERAPQVLPGSGKVVRRTYSGDPSSKAVAVAREKAAKRRGKHPDRMSHADIRKAVSEDQDAAKVRSQRNQAETAHKAKEAIGVKRGKGPTAATNLVAQGITTADRADLVRYLDEVKKAEPGLKTERLRKLNRQTQRLIQDAIKKHDPARVQEAARAYQQFVATELEPKVLAAKIVDPAKAEEARLAGIRVRRAPQFRFMHAHGERVAKLERDHAEAAYSQAVADAKSAARTSGGRVPPAEHDVLLRAIDRRDHAVAAVEHFKAAREQARMAHTKAHLQPGEQPAYVSQQPIPARSSALPTNRVTAKMKVKRTGEGIKGGTLDVHPMKLVEQAVGTQRLIDSAVHREQFVNEWSLRDGEKPRVFANPTKAKTYAQDHDLEAKSGTGWEPVRRQDGSTVLMPSEAMSVAGKFEKGTDTNPALKSYTGRWRRVVLAFSPRWLLGNTFEAAFRSLVGAAGPVSYATAHRNLRALKTLDPAKARELEARALGGGNYTQAARVAAERVTPDELGRVGRAAHRFWSHPAPQSLAKLYEGYTHIVFKTVNGTLEYHFQKAMMGKAMRRDPLINQRVVGLSAKAAQEAAEGLRNTPTQVKLGREVDRMYGQYGKYSPGLRNAISNYTPFIAWTLNSVKFLTSVLPKDHPVLTGLLASANIASEGWRKDHGLFLDALGHTEGQAAGWLMGSIPGSDGSHLRLSRYLPLGLMGSDTGPLGSTEGVLLPQLAEILKNFGGDDWSGHALAENPSFARATLAAMTSFIEGQVPIVSQAVGVSGVHLPNERDGAKHTGKLKTRLREQFDPLRWTPAKKDTTTGGSGSGVMSQKEIDELAGGDSVPLLTQDEIDALAGG
jgi:hypothetical protein